MRIKFPNKFLGVLVVAVIIATTYFANTEATATFPYQAKILDLSGDPVTEEITVMITLWSSETRGTDDYLVTKLPETNDPAYVYHGIYTATPNAFGVISIEVGSGLYPLPDPLPTSDSYMDVQIKESSEDDSFYDLMDNRIKSTGILFAVTSQLHFGIGNLSSTDLIIFDDTTGTFSGAESHDMDTTDLIIQFGDSLSKKILATWENANSWWKFSEKVNFTNGLYLNGIGLQDVGTSNITSGASLIGIYDEFNQSSATSIQAVLSDFDTAITASGGGAINRSVVHKVEYPGYSVYPDGTSNIINLFVDYEVLTGRNCYDTRTEEVLLQDIDIIVDFPIPSGFTDWQATPFEFYYKTDTADSLENYLQLISIKDTAGDPVTFSPTSSTEYNDTSWTKQSVTFSGTPTWTPNQNMIIQFKLAQKNGTPTPRAALGEILFHYVGTT